jgi:hypothetical protein
MINIFREMWKKLFYVWPVPPGTTCICWGMKQLQIITCRLRDRADECCTAALGPYRRNAKSVLITSLHVDASSEVKFNVFFIRSFFCSCNNITMSNVPGNRNSVCLVPDDYLLSRFPSVRLYARHRSRTTCCERHATGGCDVARSATTACVAILF